MSKDYYKVGKVIKFTNNGKVVGTIEIKAININESGDRQIEYEVTSLVLDYSGPIKVGMTISLTEGEFEGTL